jgi:hypothetical protein
MSALPARRMRSLVFAVLGCLGAAAAPPADQDAKTNHEGRALPPAPKVTAPILFNTPEADAVLAAMQVFPKDNPWNEDVSKRPVLKDSDRMIAQIGRDKKLAYNLDMGFILVPPDQPKVDVKMTDYPDESDKGPFPIPKGAPIEGWPLEGGRLEALQPKGDGDRHVLVVDPVNGKLYEFWRGFKTDKDWSAACEATFDLSSNVLRPREWTSSDAAGLPIFPAVVRYDEVERGTVEHALRFTVKRTRKEFIYPATHQAGRGNDPAVPAMGQRFRLKADADLSGLPKHALAIAKGLQKYGMFVADNGGDWRISVAPDERIKGLDALRRFKGGDFEVVETTGEKEGPRAK